MDPTLPDSSPMQETALYYRFNFFYYTIDRVECMPHSEAYHFNLDFYDRNINCRWVSIDVIKGCVEDFNDEKLYDLPERTPE